MTASDLRHVELAPTEAMDLSELFVDRLGHADLAA
ncbi:hypothetical protein FB463_002787 [Frigoribacterium faeni]|uniref:Uncharacterized protein n=1 Tax=Frigoribacterium faeni TaxID=145483 RepID=A0A7W3PK78_9MICO|nr:hypothetical protein [Frigoribacterium faeni]